MTIGIILSKISKISIQSAINNYKENYPYIQTKYKLIGLIGVFGFPFYYFIWNHIFPQKYESIILRSIGMIFSVLIISESKLPKIMRQHMPLLSYLFIIYGLPFFFTYMLLKNDFNVAWQMSMVGSFLFLMILHDVINIIFILLSGVLAALLCYIITDGVPSVPLEFYHGLPVYFFAFVGAILFNYSSENDKNRNRMRAIAAVGSSIAHEMRTPLLGIKFDAEGLQHYLPSLLAAQDWAITHGGGPAAFSPAQRRGLAQALERIGRQTLYANAMIDMLLMNVRDPKIDSTSFAPHTMRTVVEQALERYPFRHTERERVEVHCESDFTFMGSDLLMMHVLFNMLKNGLRAIAESDKGNVVITLKKDQFHNHIYFKDTGSGIARHVIPYIFEPFYSGSTGGGRAGIGLSFCRRVIESFEGSITCHSEYGIFTEFDVSLPKIDVVPCA